MSRRSPHLYALLLSRLTPALYAMLAFQFTIFMHMLSAEADVYV